MKANFTGEGSGSESSGCASRRSKASLGLLALAATGLAAGVMPARASEAPDFRFPVVLCDFQYSLVDEQDGYLQLVHRHTGERIFRVRNTGASSGVIAGRYAIEGTPYRFTFTGRVEQGSASEPHRILLQSRLEKLDPASGDYLFAGQRTAVATQADGPDGTLLRKVAARALNFGLDRYKGTGGKFDLTRIEQGIRWHRLDRGTVFRAGPVCLLADVETVRQVTAHPSELADVFKRYDERKNLLNAAGQQLTARLEASSAPPRTFPSVPSVGSSIGPAPASVSMPVPAAAAAPVTPLGSGFDQNTLASNSESPVPEAQAGEEAQADQETQGGEEAQADQEGQPSAVRPPTQNQPMQASGNGPAPRAPGQAEQPPVEQASNSLSLSSPSSPSNAGNGGSGAPHSF